MLISYLIIKMIRESTAHVFRSRKVWMLKKMTIADKKSTKSFRHSTSSSIFVCHLPFIVWISSKIVGFDQLWTTNWQKLVKANKKLVFLKMINTFCWFIVQNCRYFLPCVITKREVRLNCVLACCLIPCTLMRKLSHSRRHICV